jgi:hypothetical protein
MIRELHGHRRSGLAALAMLSPFLGVNAEPADTASAIAQQQAQHDGGHDFDFIIGDWKAHVKRLPDRLVGSTKWIEYDAIAHEKKLLDSNANFDDFEEQMPDGQRIKTQTLRMYNPAQHQWHIYLIDLGKGTLDIPEMVGQFNGKRGEFYDQEIQRGRAVTVRFVWTDVSPKAAHMEQAFSPDGGKTWEVNWICDLTR